MCPTEVEARAGLGVAVVVPTVLAGIGATIALGQLGAPLVGVAGGAVVVAGIVAAVDRLMVTSAVSVVSLVFRVVITLAMAWLVGEQLLLAAFASEVQAELEAIHAEHLAAATDEIDATVDDELARIDQRLAVLEAADPALVAARDALAEAETVMSERLAELEALQVELSAEIEGVGSVGRTGSAGDGPVADQIRAEIDLAQVAYDEAVATRDRAAVGLDELTAAGITAATADSVEVEQLRAERLGVEAGRAGQIDAAAERIKGAVGIVARIEALERLARTPQMAAQVWALRLLLLAIDTLPVTVKVAYTRREHRPYDTLLAAYQQVELHRADQLLADIGRPATRPKTTVAVAPSRDSDDTNGEVENAVPRRRPRGLVGGQVVEIEPGRLAARIDQATTYRQGRLNLPPAA
jgi:hypothetical protein